MNALPRLEWSPPGREPHEAALQHEWLVTNGLGGYASGSVAWCNTRKYHGLFVPALPRFGRTVMLGLLEDHVTVGDHTWAIAGCERSGGKLELPALQVLERFTLRGLIPEWDFAMGPLTLRKSVVMVHEEGTLYVIYSHLDGPPAQLRLRPYTLFRPLEEPPSDTPPNVRVLIEDRGVSVEVRPQAPQLRLKVCDDCQVPFVGLFQKSPPMTYRVDAARGQRWTDVQVSPGYFECELQPGKHVALVAAVGDGAHLERAPKDVLAMEEARERRLLERCALEAQDGAPARLALAADQFIIAPRYRPPDTGWARATGQDMRSVIAGYHWFTDWGRDTMISLEGLALCTGRAREAAAILRTFQHHVKDGLVPNFFPEGGQAGVYHTADASLWFFHAVDRYVRVTGDRSLLPDVWPTLVDIVHWHFKGTHFGIQVDAQDGLLRQGQGGYPLTWMDAKVGDWVVTPRRGKAVEVNALWFNALTLMAEWGDALGLEGLPYAAQAAKVKASFNARFWNAPEGCLFDVVDGERGDDPAIRPNQLFAISLTHPVLERHRWPAVLDTVRRHLLTPYGLRSLSPRHPDFKPAYDGDLRARDAAYHQGTVWPWLLGHYVDASLKVSEDPTEAYAALAGLVEHLQHAGLGNISEIFDAMPPYHPRGCIAQAWSVAEALRVMLKVASLKKPR
jgi:predicted glycogen debranching enzyme